MKGLKKILYLLLLLLPGIVFAAGSVTVNKSSISIENGKNATFTVTAKNAAGKVTFKSNNGAVATINKSSEWVENGSVNVTVTGKSVGSTTISVVVDAATFDEEPIKKTYTVTVNVTKPKSNNGNLSSLSVDGKAVPGFSASKTSYSLGNTKNNSITIAASAEDSNAKVSGTGSKTLRYGKNTFNVVVTAENGSKKTYSVSITKDDDRNTDNTLKSLSVSPGSISFDKNTTSYTIKLEHDVNSINISAQANDSKATVSGAGTKTLKDYANNFNVVVTAENGSKKTYTIKVLRKDASGNFGQLSKDNDLKSLTIEGYEINFNKDKMDYDLTVEEDVDSIKVNAIATSEAATVSVTGNDNLKPGDNEVKVNVTAENGEVKTYTIKVYKKGTVKEETTKTSEKSEDENKTNVWMIVSIVELVIITGLIGLLAKNR